MLVNELKIELHELIIHVCVYASLLGFFTLADMFASDKVKRQFSLLTIIIIIFYGRRKTPTFF